ncbi:MAG: DUF1080 domain-containing protein [Pirellulales bacterium]
MAKNWWTVAIGVALMLWSGQSLRAQDKADMPFNGKNLDGWKLKGANKEKSKWTVGKAKMDPESPRGLVVMDAKQGDGELVNAQGGGVDIYTEQKWGDATIELELMVPQRSNSGVYVMGEYEVQVLDSFGKQRVGPGDIGGLYNAAAPKKNAAKEPGQWQKFVLEFQAPKYEGDKKVAHAKFVKVTLNGEVIHENVEMKGVTPTGVTGKEAPTGPLMFQGDHGPVAFRNIKITPK